MADSVEKLTAISKSRKSVAFKVPLVYVKGKLILTLNSSNRMQFGQRMSIKNKYKKIIEPMIRKLGVFDDDNIHLIIQIYFSDRRSRDMDNQIFLLKWVQDAMVELGVLNDDKHISFTFLPKINDPKLEEHYCEITVLERERINNDNEEK